MAKLSELKKSAELTIRKVLNKENFLIWTNEMLQDLSEIAKQEADLLEAQLNTTSFLLDRDVNGVIEQLEVDGNSIQLPSDFMQIVKVEADIRDRRYLFYQRSLGDSEITTLQNHPNQRQLPHNNVSNLYFIDYTSNKLVLKSSLLDNTNSIKVRIYYYKELPPFDATDTNLDLSTTTLPFEKRFHKLLTYYAIKKYYETWQDENKTILYDGFYSRTREEFDSAVLRRHQENEPSQQLLESRWV